MGKWINELVEYGSFGDSPILIVAPHEGVSLELIERNIVKIGERGTGYLTKLAAKHIGASYMVVNVPRMEADFARNPSELGRGAKFKYNVNGKILELMSHRNTAYAELLRQFHELIEEFNPKFLLTFHRMGGSDGIDVRLGFGRERQYIGGSENALKFRDTVLMKSQTNLKILVSKLKLAGESEFILNSHYRGRLAGLVEFSSKRFFLSKGSIDPQIKLVAKTIAEVAREWV